MTKWNISPRSYGKCHESNNVYGEISGFDLLKIIQDLPIMIETFLDVGSGCGGPLMTLVEQGQVVYACGIEKNTYRYEKSNVLLSQKSEDIQQKVEFIEDTFENHSFVPYDVVYCCNTMFDVPLNTKLVQKCLDECMNVFLLFTLEPRCLQYYWKCVKVNTSWKDNVNVFMYKKY
jgi:2-polyprenyl-3-methyl-5-hydroxy-6-metoxy-1,4-benzoquinol methylase